MGERLDTISGVASVRWKEVMGVVPFLMDSMRDWPPAAAAPASRAAWAVAGSSVKTATEKVLPLPWGRAMDPRRDWPGFRAVGECGRKLKKR